MISYGAAWFPVRVDLEGAHERLWQRLRRPRTCRTSSDRIILRLSEELVKGTLEELADAQKLYFGIDGSGSCHGCRWCGVEFLENE